MVSDQVLLSASKRNFDQCVQVAQEQGLGIEVMTFAFPDVLDGEWKSLVKAYRAQLRSVPGKLAMHGPFMDMAPGSPDSKINQAVIKRYQQAIQIGAELGTEVIVFHANFIAAIHTNEYRSAWHTRNVDFWGPMAEFAQQHGVTLAVENMWEYDPNIIADVLKAINNLHLRACLDVGHAHLFGEVPFESWLKALEPLLVHSHMNNNNGKIDVHQAFDNGVLDYHRILPQMRALSAPPTMTLEMDEVESMLSSLKYFQLIASAVEPPEA